MLHPVPPKTPDYPGGARRRDFFRTLRLFLHGQVTLPVCVFLVLSGAQAFADTPQPMPSRQGTVVAQAAHPEPPCGGKPMPPDPMPCRGDVAEPNPPPCSGAVPAVEPPIAPPPGPPENPPCAGAPRLHPPPQQLEPVAPLGIRDLIDRPADHAGQLVQVSGNLGRLTDGSLFEDGYFLYLDRPVSPAGKFYGCPLIGRFPAVSEGDPVTVVGRVVRRQEAASPKRPAGTYYVLQVETLQSR